MKRALIYLFVTGFMAGCSGDDPAKPKPPIIEPPPGRTTPQRGVEYYRLAWETRDSTRIDSVLAVDYQGTSTEIGANPQMLSFVKSDEVRAVHAMKSDATITSVIVDLGPLNSWIRTSFAGDPPDWAVVIIPNPAISLRYADGSELAVSPSNEEVEFKLKPTAAGLDTTWQIIRWKEVHQSP